MKNEVVSSSSFRLLRSAVVAFAIAAITFLESSLAASPPGDVVGKVTVGYQAWFGCGGDGSSQNNWKHWSPDSNVNNPPSPSNAHGAAWPDVREFTKTYQSGYANLGNGQPAKLFSSYDQQTIDTQVRWMQQYGIDTIAVQRFGSGGNSNNVATKVKNAAEAFGRKFYIMLDFNVYHTFADLQSDWLTFVQGLTASPAYAKQNGKPVIAMWGIGMSYMSTADQTTAINYFKSQGCYVIGGVERWWRSHPELMSLYHSLNMITPWLIGSVGDVAGMDYLYNTIQIGDQADCNANGVDYQPAVLPGDISQAGQRAHGDLMWRGFYNVTRLGAQGVYITMYDEFDEGNMILKAPESSFYLPVNGSFKGLNEDGTYCTADYYLRLAQDGAKMFKGQIALTSVRPTIPNPAQSVVNGVYRIVARHSGKALDVYGQGTGNGADVDQWGFTGGGNQLWSVMNLGNGQYEIVGVQSNKALDVSGQSVADGANVQIWDYNGGNNQKWTITPTSGGYYAVRAVHSGKALDVYAASTADGANVDQWSANGGSNQEWAFQVP